MSEHGISATRFTDSLRAEREVTVMTTGKETTELIAFYDGTYP